MKYIFATMITTCMLTGINAQTTSTTTNAQEPVYEMKQYYFVLLTKGPHRDQDSATAATIQQGHMANINRLASEKKLVVAGPFTDDKDWRGIFIFDVATEKEVIDLLLTDPAITSGRLVYEIHPWLTAKGNCFP